MSEWEIVVDGWIFCDLMKTINCFLKVEGLEKILNIFMSESVDDDVRKSASEQLSVMLHGIYFWLKTEQTRFLTLVKLFRHLTKYAFIIEWFPFWLCNFCC